MKVLFDVFPLEFIIEFYMYIFPDIYMHILGKMEVENGKEKKDTENGNFDSSRSLSPSRSHMTWTLLRKSR